MRIKPKKKLGQNFLIDKNIQEKIINSLKLSPQDTVLEIGPGQGALTEQLCKKCKEVFAVEIDSSLCQILRNNLSGYPNLKIINSDILKLDLKKYFPGFKEKIRVVGNIPYYISTPILEHLFKFKGKFEDIYISLQKEYANRIIAYPGTKDYSCFTCFVQYHATPKVLFSIKKNSFRPKPKIDSSFVSLKLREKGGLSSKKEEFLFKIIRAAFNQRRKTLKNSLKNSIGKERLKTFFKKYQIDPRTRPEDLSLDNFINLIK